MTHLRIEQSTSGNEYVTSNVIHKLYETAKGILDEEALNEVEKSQVSLQGSLVVPKAYGDEIDWLETKFPDLHITAGARYIRFEDSNVLSILTQYWGDGTGITEALALSVQHFNGKFANNTSILTFDEFYKFPNITEINNNNKFNSCTNLKSIDLRNITKIAGENGYQRWNFEGCSNLESVGDTSNCTYFGQLAFDSCSKLTEVNLVNATYIGNKAFSNCVNLRSITSILNATSIGYDAFYKCAKVQEFESLNLPNLQTLGIENNGTFVQCTQIKHIVDLGTIPSIGAVWDGTFYNCTNLEDAILPESVTTIGYHGFSGCTKLKYIKILSTSVPTYTLTDGFGNMRSYGRFFGERYSNEDPMTDTYTGLTFPIYVVDSLLSQYQAADGWKYVGPNANRLKPLSQFATDFPNG